MKSYVFIWFKTQDNSNKTKLLHFLLSFVVVVAPHLLLKYKPLHEKNTVILIIYFFQSVCTCINFMSSDRPINVRKEMLLADEQFLKL